MNEELPNDPAFEALISRSKAGDPDSINELFREFYPAVQRLVHRSLDQDLRRSRPWLTARFSTGDVVQEVFRSALTDLRSFGGSTPRSFAAYLSMVVRNRIIDAIRFHEADQRDGRRPSASLMETYHASTDEDPGRIAESNDEIARFFDALANFPEREQLLLRARFEGTATFPELAETLGYSSESAARRAFFTSQSKLAVQLGEQGQLGEPGQLGDRVQGGEA